MPVIVILTLLLVAIYLGLMQFYGWGWILTPLFEPKNSYQPQTKVSVLVACRNEQYNIGNLLESLLAQDYPKELLEIIIIDDHSEDATTSIAAQLGAMVLSLPPNLSSKKASIAYGVTHASGQLIITTDADCTMGKSWITTVAQFYETSGYKVITGPVSFSQPINQSTDQLLYHFQSLDLMGLMFITAGSLRFKFPHMANGANFAFEKKLFENIGGYSGIDKTPTGDDILFLLKAHSHRPGCAGFIKAKEAIVTTQAAGTWQAFWQQRLRWVSKSTDFNDARLTAIMVFYYCYALATVVFGVWYVLNPIMFAPFMLLLLGKWVPELVMMAHAAAFFGRKKQLLWFIPAQLMHQYYVLRVGIQAQFTKYQWKGREYRSSKKPYK